MNNKDNIRTLLLLYEYPSLYVVKLIEYHNRTKRENSYLKYVRYQETTKQSLTTEAAKKKLIIKKSIIIKIIIILTKLILTKIILTKIITDSPSVIPNHRVNFNHNFKWNDVRILDSESSYNKRLISEMIHIKRQKLNFCLLM